MNCCNAYESESMHDVLGETLRPGGFSLTDQGIQVCSVSAGDRVLDLGCGRGATVNYLQEKFHLHAVGVDPSKKLIEAARQQYPYAEFYSGKGENLPFERESFDCVMAECTLSLMDVDRTLNQVDKVLKENGWLVISDVYARNPEGISALQAYSINSCMRGLHSLPKLKKKLQKANFQICLEEDFSGLLKELLVKIAFSYGSMRAFWNMTTQNCIDGCSFHEALKLCKPGYFLLIARKAGTIDG